MSERAIDVVYGKQAVEEARRGKRKVIRVWEQPEAPPYELDELAGSQEHQGIVAEVEPYPYADPTTLLAEDDALVLVLDQVQDPHNLGAAARAAEVAGAAGLVIPERRSASVTGAAVKASAGALEHLPVARVTNIADWLGTAKEQGAWVYGAEEGGETLYSEADLKGRCVIVMGGEGSGIRPRVKESCDAIVSIPVRGEVGSLNVSVAAAVLLFEAVRQRQP